MTWIIWKNKAVPTAVDMQHSLKLSPLTETFFFADYDDYLDDDDLDLIEENLGVKVKRRVRIVTIFSVDNSDVYGDVTV